jgi:CBS domain-containing protein
MRVKEIMTRGVECVAPEATLQQAARKMRELDVGILPICNEDGMPIGMVTDRDIVVRGVAGGQNPQSCDIRTIMTPETICCNEDQDVQEAANMMQEHQIRRLLVLDDRQRLVGIVSLGDLAVDAGDVELAGDALAGVSEPAMPMP